MERKFLKYFFLFFILSFLIINWNKISFLFNWHVILKILETPFEKKIEEKIEPPKKIEEKECEISEKEDSIEIPKIGVFAPIVFVGNEKEIKEALDRGVVHFPGSALPGEKGQTILEGHSSPPGWPKIKYDWVFSDLKELEAGDEIFVFFKNCQYSYKVSEKIFLERGEELPEDLTNSKNILILISCWPPGKDVKRIAIQAILDKNN